MYLCQVYLLDTTFAYDKAYTYLVPEDLWDKVRVGVLAVVPFGKSNRRQSAFVVKVWEEESPSAGVKPLLAVPDYDLAATDEAMALAAFIRDRCFCTYGSASISNGTTS